METEWVWKRVSEKGPAKNQYHVSQEGFPGEWLNLSLGISQCGSGAGKEQINLQGSSKEWSDSHLPEPCRMQRKSRRIEGEKRQLDMGSCGKRSLLSKNFSPVSLAHASEEFSAQSFGFHSKPAKSMGITQVFSVFWTESFQNKQWTETQAFFFPVARIFSIPQLLGSWVSFPKQFPWEWRNDHKWLKYPGSLQVVPWPSQRDSPQPHTAWRSRDRSRQAGSQHCGSPAQPGASPALQELSFAHPLAAAWQCTSPAFRKFNKFLRIWTYPACFVFCVCNYVQVLPGCNYVQ